MSNNLKRTHFSQLPSMKEAEEIIKKEAKRDLVPSKIDRHYADFTSVIKWLVEIGMDSHIFKDQCEWQEVVGRGEEMKEELVEKTVAENYEPWEVTEYLGEEDVPEKSDLIMLFGSNSKKRVEKTWEWWQKGLASKIIITGGKPNYVTESKISEAEIFGNDLIDLGIPEDKIIIENKSITIPDNVRSSLNLLDSLNVRAEKIITVLAWFAMRRAWIHLMKYGPEKLVVYKTSAEIIDTNLSKENWFRSELGIKTIFDQFVKMRMATVLNTA